jgi:POT family proton-dependent oligopeptide transporter
VDHCCDPAAMNAASDLETMEVAMGHEAKVTLPATEGGHESSFSTQVEEYVQPTEGELASLRRVSGKIPWTAYAVAFIELCERFSYYGTTAVCK